MRRSLLLVVGLLMACDNSSSNAPMPDRSLQSLRAAATQVSVGSTMMTAQVEAWRSYQPIKGDEGDPMIAVIRLSTASSGGVPGDLGVETVYLMRGDEVVTADAREEQPRGPNATSIEFVVRDGPRWTPGDSMDVVVGLTHRGGKTALLRAPRVALARVS